MKELTLSEVLAFCSQQEAKREAGGEADYSRLEVCINDLWRRYKPDEIPNGTELFKYTFRLRPETITLTYEIPVPVTETLSEGQEYYVAGPNGMMYDSVWRDQPADRDRLAAKSIYLTYEDARAAHDARLKAVRKAMEGRG